jgi:hypothetical protein
VPQPAEFACPGGISSINPKWEWSSKDGFERDLKFHVRLKPGD